MPLSTLGPASSSRAPNLESVRQASLHPLVAATLNATPAQLLPFPELLQPLDGHACMWHCMFTARRALHLQAELLIAAARSSIVRDPPAVPEIPDEITGTARRRSMQNISLNSKRESHQQAIALRTVGQGSARLALRTLGSL